MPRVMDADEGLLERFANLQKLLRVVANLPAHVTWGIKDGEGEKLDPKVYLEKAKQEIDRITVAHKEKKNQKQGPPVSHSQ